MQSRGYARVGGWAALVTGVLGAAAAVVLIFVPAAVPETVFSYPLTPVGHAVAQTAFGIHHLVAAFALWALVKLARPVPRTRLPTTSLACE